METFSKKSLFETVEASQDYLVLLDSLLTAAEAAEEQVIESSKKSITLLEDVFEEITSNILIALNSRKKHLIEVVNQYKTESLSPLTKSKSNIINCRNNCNMIIEDAKKVLDSGGFTSEGAYSDFMDKSSHIGSLPALPDVEFIPNITFSGSPYTILTDITANINNFGTISKIGPVQISHLEPYPGSLLVRWEEIDNESHLDIQSYRLQIALHDAWNLDTNIENVFRDVYQGSDQTFLVRDLRFQQKYCFRVCCRISENCPWSSWSYVKISSTEVPPYKWDLSNSNYLLSDDDRLARVIGPEACSILFSSEAHIKNGNSVQFIVLNAGESSTEEGVALMANKLCAEKWHNAPGSFFVSFKGDIYVGGRKKTIGLPTTGKRDQIIFSCEIVKSGWRVTVEIGAKAVTYDWNPGTNHLFFAACLNHPEIQVLVE